MPPGIFHSTQQSPDAHDSVGTVKKFVGSGTAILEVPGLKKVLSVHVGRQRIPLERDYKYPLNSDAQRHEMVRTTLPMIGLQDNEEGVTILLRSKHSNDGIWQKGEDVFVGGDWEDSEDEDPAVGTKVTTAAKPKGRPKKSDEDTAKKLDDPASTSDSDQF